MQSHMSLANIFSQGFRPRTPPPPKKRASKGAFTRFRRMCMSWWNTCFAHKLAHAGCYIAESRRARPRSPPAHRRLGFCLPPLTAVSDPVSPHPPPSRALSPLIHRRLRPSLPVSDSGRVTLHKPLGAGESESTRAVIWHRPQPLEPRHLLPSSSQSVPRKQMDRSAARTVCADASSDGICRCGRAGGGMRVVFKLIATW